MRSRSKLQTRRRLGVRATSTSRGSAPKRVRKTKWLFTLAGEPWFCIAGVLRPGAAPDGTDAFAMLTTEPGPNVAPIHPRQVVVLGPGDWAQWLDGPEPEALLRPSPVGALVVERLG